MASLTWWTWVWVNSGSWWWTGRPGVLRCMGSQRVGHDWATDLIWSSWVFKLSQELSLCPVTWCSSIIYLGPTPHQGPGPTSFSPLVSFKFIHPWHLHCSSLTSSLITSLWTLTIVFRQGLSPLDSASTTFSNVTKAVILSSKLHVPFLTLLGSSAPGNKAWVYICHVINLVEGEQEWEWWVSPGPTKNMETILDISNQGFNTEKCLYNCWRVWGSRRQWGKQGVSKKEVMWWEPRIWGHLAEGTSSGGNLEEMIPDGGATWSRGRTENILAFPSSFLPNPCQCLLLATPAGSHLRKPGKCSSLWYRAQ